MTIEQVARAKGPLAEFLGAEAVRAAREYLDSGGPLLTALCESRPVLGMGCADHGPTLDDYNREAWNPFESLTVRRAYGYSEPDPRARIA